MKNISGFLSRETQDWVVDGLISPEQAAAIRARYPEAPAAASWTMVLFSCLGAVLLGLGLILFFAYNWDDMSKYAKLGVVFAGLTGTHFLADRLTKREMGRMAEGIHLLGTMFFGAGIWLIAQIYHLNEHYPNAFFVWALGALAMAWARPSVPQGILAAVLLIVWNGSELLDFDAVFHSAPFLILAGLLPLAILRQSRVLGTLTVAAFITSLTMTAGILDDDLVPPALFFSCVAVMGVNVLRGDRSVLPPMKGSFPFSGGLVYLLLVFLFGFDEFLGGFSILRLGGPLEWIYFSGPLAAAAAVFFVLILRIRRSAGGGRLFPETGPLTPKADPLAYDPILRTHMGNVLGASILLLFAQFFHGPAEVPIMIFFNLIFLCHAVLFLYQGCRKRHIRLILLSCLMIGAQTLARFHDLFDSLLARSLVFCLVGAGFFVFGKVFTRDDGTMEADGGRA